MPVTDQTDYPSDVLPPGSYWAGHSQGFDYAAVDARLEDGDSDKQRHGAAIETAAEALGEMLRVIAGNGWSVKGAQVSSAACGKRALIILWVMHPDRMPWALGVPQSGKSVAKRIGVTPDWLYRMAAQYTRQWGLRNAFQAHYLNQARNSGKKTICVPTKAPRGSKESFSGKSRAGAGTERPSRERKTI